MKVTFRQAFFGPNGSRYRPKVEYDVPDEWRGKLPKGAMILEEELLPRTVKAVPETAPGKPVTALASAAAGASAKGAKL